MTEPLHPSIAAHYARGEEPDRLGGDIPTLEALRTRILLARYLPEAPAVVLDVGGAAGAYALPLARQGYDVHLVDPWAAHVEEAARRSAEQPDTPLTSVRLGEARQLSAADASVDAVLLLGPLYHLVDAADRAAALGEAFRVLRPGGVLLA
ncbi:MAG: class I SAM-dependent methyltransferase, partial [Geodermatophilaceae bacterium]|nr:class I SAM-dependent methyltransferase [Geodermatophilaceae bacterium]